MLTGNGSLQVSQFTNGTFTLPATPAHANGKPRLPRGGFCTPVAEADYRRVNEQVKEATRLG